MIVDATIATLYIDGVALNARMYTRPGASLSVFVTDDAITVQNASISKGI